MIIFSENKNFFDLNEIFSVVRRALCQKKRALLKTCVYSLHSEVVAQTAN